MGWAVIDSSGRFKHVPINNAWKVLDSSGRGKAFLDSSMFTGTNWTDLTDGGATTLHTHVGGGFTLGTEQASTSGTAIDFTGIPAGTKIIVVEYVGVSISGTANLRIQLGDSGGFETTGYLGTDQAFSTITNWSAGFDTNAFGATALVHGAVILTLEDSTDFTWICSGQLGSESGAQNLRHMAGSKSLSAELTQIRITTSNGTDTFDAGSLNILYSS